MAFIAEWIIYSDRTIQRLAKASSFIRNGQKLVELLGIKVLHLKIIAERK